MPSRIQSQVVPSIQPVNDSPAKVRRDFRKLLEEGCVLCPAGRARRQPRRLLRLGYVPTARFQLFDTEYFLAPPRQNEDIRFFVAYLRQHRGRGAARKLFPRIFYKDVSLVWRSASHVVRSAEENWIGKGDVQLLRQNGEEIVVSDEATTDLPLEIQTALEVLLRRANRIARDDEAVELILRGGPDDRVEPYRDFTAPRRRAEADPRNRLNRGRPVAATRPRCASRRASSRTSARASSR
ncbi:MAG: hypothetical protein CL910_16585 [Deltaproteobacteria bacterium]|nr:hypothetical protein [Deltaproteobacteria bacterium]